MVRVRCRKIRQHHCAPSTKVIAIKADAGARILTLAASEMKLAVETTGVKSQCNRLRQGPIAATIQKPTKDPLRNTPKHLIPMKC